MSNEPGRSFRLFILLLKLTADVSGSPCVPPDLIKLNEVTTVFWMEAKSLLWPSGCRLSFHRYVYCSATRYKQKQPLTQNYDLWPLCCNLPSVSRKSVWCILANNAPINTLRSEDGCITSSIFTFVSMLHFCPTYKGYCYVSLCYSERVLPLEIGIFLNSCLLNNTLNINVSYDSALASMLLCKKVFKENLSWEKT